MKLRVSGIKYNVENMTHLGAQTHFFQDTAGHD